MITIGLIITAQKAAGGMIFRVPSQLSSYLHMRAGERWYICNDGEKIILERADRAGRARPARRVSEVEVEVEQEQEADLEETLEAEAEAEADPGPPPPISPERYPIDRRCAGCGAEESEVVRSNGRHIHDPERRMCCAKCAPVCARRPGNDQAVPRT